MSNYRQNYTLYYRKQAKKGYWYYQTYSSEGRTTGKSTGKTSKAAARLYCDELLKQGKLYTGNNVFFKDYATGFFNKDSAWISDRMEGSLPGRPAISKSYIDSLNTCLNRYIIPFFGKYKLKDLKPSLTKKFRSKLLSTGIAPKGKTAKPLSSKTVNNALATFRIICDVALADGDIPIDPLKTIKLLPKNAHTRDAFKIEEVKTLLMELKDSVAFTPILTAACTGLRIAEVLAIREGKIHDTWLDITDQYYHNELRPLKTKFSRKIPTCESLHKIVLGDFSATYEKIHYDFNKAVDTVLSHDIRIKRGLCIHSLRHFFNTYLLAENVPPVKVAAVLGHSTGIGSMQERYTNWRPEMFPEVYAAQEKLLKQLKVKL